MKFLLVAVFVLCSILLYLFNKTYFTQVQQTQTVPSVIDGDSFHLSDGTRVRLLGVDAPEKGRCGYEEAKKRLQQIVEGKEVTLSDTLVDDYGRTLANVSVGSQFVNEIMVSEGLVKYTYVKSPKSVQMKQSSDTARKEQRGIYAKPCRSTEPLSECVIKGNIKNGNSLYHLPNCFNYDQTIVDTSFGDAWFCSEEEALKAGFSKSTACP